MPRWRTCGRRASSERRRERAGGSAGGSHPTHSGAAPAGAGRRAPDHAGVASPTSRLPSGCNRRRGGCAAGIDSCSATRTWIASGSCRAAAAGFAPGGRSTPASPALVTTSRSISMARRGPPSSPRGRAPRIGSVSHCGVAVVSTIIGCRATRIGRASGDHSSRRKSISRWWRVAGSKVPVLADCSLVLPPDEAAEARMEALLAELAPSRPRIGLAPAATWQAKTWPESSWARAADLYAEAGAVVLLLWGRGGARGRRTGARCNASLRRHLAGDRSGRTGRRRRASRPLAGARLWSAPCGGGARHADPLSLWSGPIRATGIHRSGRITACGRECRASDAI